MGLESEILCGCRLLETVINYGSLSQWGSATEDRKISRAGDSVSEHNQRKGVGTQRHFKGHTQVQIYSNLILLWVLSTLAVTKGEKKPLQGHSSLSSFLGGGQKCETRVALTAR